MTRKDSSGPTTSPKRTDLEAIGKNKPHGTRSRYVSGCRCAECREVNRLYYHTRVKAKRRGDWNGLIDATLAREHMKQLEAAGIGLRTVADVTGLGRTMLTEVRAGRQPLIRARNAQAILKVEAGITLDNTHVPAAETWARINELLLLGMTKSGIAKELGSMSKVPALQVRRVMVRARTAQAVERLHKKVVAELRLKHEVREEMTSLATRTEEVDFVLEQRAERRKDAQREANRDYARRKRKKAAAG